MGWRHTGKKLMVFLFLYLNRQFVIMIRGAQYQFPSLFFDLSAYLCMIYFYFLLSASILLFSVLTRKKINQQWWTWKVRHLFTWSILHQMHLESTISLYMRYSTPDKTLKNQQAHIRLCALSLRQLWQALSVFFCGSNWFYC